MAFNPFQKTKLKAREFEKTDKPTRPIVDIYSKLVNGNMKITGRAILVCCPVHEEAHPSCALYPDTNSFYCFSCGANGDYITLVEKIMHVDFKEALKIIEKL